MTRAPGFYWVRTRAAYHDGSGGFTFSDWRSPEVAELHLWEDGIRSNWETCGSDEGAMREGHTLEVLSERLTPPNERG